MFSGLSSLIARSY